MTRSTTCSNTPSRIIRGSPPMPRSRRFPRRRGERSTKRAHGCSRSKPLPAEVEAFLERGEAPMLVGFGSMPAAASVSRPADRSGACRGPQNPRLERWAGLEAGRQRSRLHGAGRREPPNAFSASRGRRPSRRCRHHGGRSPRGSPASRYADVRRPVLLGRPYRGLELGATTPYATLTEDSLTEALQTALAPAVVARAAAFAAQVRADGATVAARRLELDYDAPGN